MSTAPPTRTDHRPLDQRQQAPRPPLPSESGSGPLRSREPSSRTELSRLRCAQTEGHREHNPVRGPRLSTNGHSIASRWPSTAGHSTTTGHLRAGPRNSTTGHLRTALVHRLATGDRRFEANRATAHFGLESPVRELSSRDRSVLKPRGAGNPSLFAALPRRPLALDSRPPVLDSRPAIARGRTQTPYARSPRATTFSARRSLSPYMKWLLMFSEKRLASVVRPTASATSRMCMGVAPQHTPM